MTFFEFPASFQAFRLLLYCKLRQIGHEKMAFKIIYLKSF